MHLSPEAAALARSQSGVVSRRQLLDLGVTYDAIAWAVGRTARMVLPGVIALQTGPPSDHQRLVAAFLFAGPHAVVAGSTAAGQFGVTAVSAGPPFQFLVPATQRARRHHLVRVTRTTLYDDRIWQRGPLRICDRPRAVVDAARWATDERLARAIVIEAVQRRMVRLDDLEHWIDRIGRRHSVWVRRALSEAASGAWSVPEAELLALLRTSALLPDVWANPQLRTTAGAKLTSPDAWIDQTALAVMVHSRQYHAGVLDWDATVGADAELVAAGVRVVGVTPHDISANPSVVLSRVERTYASALGSTRPDVVATRR